MKKFILVFTAFLSLYIATAQSVTSELNLSKVFEKSLTIDKFLALPEPEFWKNCKSVPLQNPGYEDGTGTYAWPPALKRFPKKVALLSFVIFDPGFFVPRIEHYGTSLSVSGKKGVPVSIDNTGQLTDYLYEQTLSEIKKSFNFYGSQLVTPEEILSTGVSAASYNSFRYRENGSTKWINKENGSNILMIPKAQQMYYAANLADPAFADAVGAKAAELGFDAVAVIKMLMGIDKSGTISIQSISYGIYGSNPVLKSPDQKNANTGSKSEYHTNVIYNVKSLGAFDLNEPTNTLEGLNIVVYAENSRGKVYKFDGIGKLISKVVMGTNYELNAWIGGQWKPFKYK